MGLEIVSEARVALTSLHLLHGRFSEFADSGVTLKKPANGCLEVIHVEDDSTCCIMLLTEGMCVPWMDAPAQSSAFTTATCLSSLCKFIACECRC